MAEVFVIPDITGDGIPDLDLTTALAFGTINGAIFQDAANVGAGTGNYNTFLALQDDNEDDASSGNDSDGVETGFNAGQSGGGAQANPEDDSNDEMDASKSEAILLGAIPIKIVNGIAYYEFRVDLNEANSGDDTLISLDQFKLYVGPYDLDGDPPNPVPSTSGQNDPNIDLVDTFGEVGALAKVYDMDAGQDVSVLMDEGNSSGSGNDDYVVLVPVSNFAGRDPATTYVYLFVQMGAAGGDTDGDGAIGDPDDDQTWVVNGGFHEWNLQNAVIIQGTKFNDLDGDGTRDPGEPGLENVTIYIDDDLDGIVEATDNNGQLDAGEQFDITDSNGNYSFGGIPVFDTDYTINIREIVPPGSVPTTQLPVEVTIDSSFAAGTIITTTNVPGLLIGNRLLTPSVTITKSASVPGGCADTVGELITYTIVVDNDGDLTLTNVVLSDNFEGGGNVTLIVGDDGDGVLEVGEVVRTGDTNGNNQMETTETWTYTYVRSVTQAMLDSNGGGNGTLTDVATVNADSANGSVTDNDDASVDVCPEPDFTAVKSIVSVEGGVELLGGDPLTTADDAVDSAGDKINYRITIVNTGNVTLDGESITDTFEGAASGLTAADFTETGGDAALNGNGILDVGETWTYDFTEEVSQAELDALCADDETITNTLAASFVFDGETLGPKGNTVNTTVVCNPLVELIKYVDVGFGFDDANTGPGPQNVNVGGDVDFKITVENKGNVTLTAVDINDTYLSGGPPGTTNLLVDDGALTAYALAHGAVLTGDDDDGDSTNGFNADGILQVGETWTITYTEAFDPLSFDPGAHLNTADVTTAEGATDEDSAYYFSLIDVEGPGVRTPGFWQNENNGGQFWNGDPDDAKNSGDPCFPVDDLLRIDSDQDGDIDENDTGFSMHNGVLGLFIGDYDRSGTADADEDVIFISRTDAMKLLSSNTKDMNDMAVKIGRDAVATWLNYLAGNEIGEDPDASFYSPKEAINDAIDYLQTYAGVLNGGSSEIWDVYKPNHPAVTNKAKPAEFAAGTPIHNALDEYNNFGTINGHEWAHDCDDAEFVSALTAYHSAHHDLF